MKDAANPLWEYSVRLYAQPGVAQCCLALQDRRQADVNLLLYAAWLASLRRQLTPAHLQQMETAVRAWRAEVLQPLRTVRQRLRDWPRAEQLREDAGRLELAAERVQQDMMLEVHRSAGLPAKERVACRDNLAVIAGGAIDEPLWSRLYSLLDNAGGALYR